MVFIKDLPFPTLVVDRMLHIKEMSNSALQLLGPTKQFSDILDAGSLKKQKRLLDETINEPIELTLKTRKDHQVLFSVAITWNDKVGTIQLYELGDKIEQIMTVVQQHQNRLAHVDFELLSQKEIAEKQLVQIKQLSAPIIPLSKNVALVPLFGHLDDDLILNTQNRLTSEIYERHLTSIIFDFNGIDQITKLGIERFQEIIETLLVMGAQPYLVGIKPEHTNFLKNHERIQATYFPTLEEAISLLT